MKVEIKFHSGECFTSIRLHFFLLSASDSTCRIEDDLSCRIASHSPSSHDASCQTMLTNVSRSVGGAVHVPESCHGIRCLSETSSDDQEVMSITKDGTITISWVDSEAAAAMSALSSRPMAANTSSVHWQSLSDSSPGSSGDVDQPTADVAVRSRLRHSSDADCKTGSGLLATENGVTRKAMAIQTSERQYPDAAAVKKSPINIANGDQSPKGFVIRRTAPKSFIEYPSDQRLTVIENSSNRVADAKYGGTSPRTGSWSPIISSPMSTQPLISANIANNPSIKTAYVRQLTTSSPVQLTSLSPVQLSAVTCRTSPLDSVHGSPTNRTPPAWLRDAVGQPSTCRRLSTPEATGFKHNQPLVSTILNQLEADGLELASPLFKVKDECLRCNPVE